MKNLRTVIVSKGSIVKIEGVPFVLVEDAKIKGTPENIALIFDLVKKEKDDDDRL